MNEFLNKFAELIKVESGIVFHEDNLYQLENRLNTLLENYHENDLAVLWNRIQNGEKDLKDKLIDLATNNETYFFRDEKLFTALSDVLKKFTTRPVRIWSAACSKGQEALSIAITLQALNIEQFEITATDLSHTILESAKKFKYTIQEVQRGLSQMQLDQYFELSGGCYQFKPCLSQKISYQRLNLLESYPFPDAYFDFIFCRNVLIYQSDSRKMEILKKILLKLRPGGYLLLGTGESALLLEEYVSQEIIHGALFYQKKF